MNYILVFSYEEFTKAKELLNSSENCYILPKELDENINEKNKIVLDNLWVDESTVKQISLNVEKIVVFSFLQKSKQPLENSPEEFSNFIKTKFISLIKIVQPLIKVSREKQKPIIFFVQEIAAFANSFDFFNILFIDMMQSFVLGLWNELKKFGVKPQLFILSKNFKDVKKINKKIKNNNQPIVKLNLKSNFLKKTKSSSIKCLNKVSYA